MSNSTRKDPPAPHTRICVYLPERMLRELKSALALDGLSVSEFFRRAAVERVRGKSNSPRRPSPRG